ncbi:transposase, partial [Candidatus Borrarchaeum sp.]|uniref:transposase n=1 Tax=Candidatus Borrarchaeum sp. TaxID=2846742 RepID=UPI00257CD8F7
YELNVVIEKNLRPSVKSIAGIDLGLKRLAVAVTSNLSGTTKVHIFPKEDFKDFFISMRRLNNRIGKLKRVGKFVVLKKLYYKRNNFAKDFRHKLAHEISQYFARALVIIGHPEKIRYSHYKGSGHRKNRKRTNQWPFKELAATLAQAIFQQDGIPVLMNEWWTTHRCSQCGSRQVHINDRDFVCLKCGFAADRDVNAAFNILQDGLQYLTQSKRQKKHKHLPQVFLKGTGGAVNHPELSMSRLSVCTRVDRTVGEDRSSELRSEQFT